MIQEQPFSLQVIQKIELVILKDITDFCINHNIRYFLYCGTLLGCIRHGGFIPWDDDIDIAIPLSDYKIFCELISKDNQFLEKYYVNGLYNNKKSYDIWTKIIRKNTVYCEKDLLHADADKGISMDIYPLIGEYDGKIPQKIQSIALSFQHNLYLWDYAKKTNYYFVLDPRIKRILRIARFFPDSIRIFLINFIKYKFWPSPEGHKKAGTIDAAPFDGKFEYKKCTETVLGVFEGENYPIPKDYDYFLRIMYGDYMELPPIEKRKLHHIGDVYFAFDQDVAEEAGIEI